MAATSPRRVAAGMIFCASLLSAGCGGPGHQAPTSRAVAKSSPASAASSPSATPSTMTDAQTREEVVSAYLAFMGEWHMAAFNPADQGDHLGGHASGKALAMITEDVKRSRRAGTIAKGPLKFDPAVTQLDLHANPATAFIDDCVDATQYLNYSASTGLPVGTPDPDTRRQHVTARLFVVDGVWKVDELHIYQSGSCR